MIDENIKVLREGHVKKNDYILYWMQAAQRTESNPALNYAINRANQLEVPLVVVFNIVNDFPDANLRHYYFMLEGLQEVSENLKEMQIKFIIRFGDPVDNIKELNKDAIMLISDRGYLNLERKWRKKLKKRIKNRFVLVNTNTIVPVDQASDKEEYGAYTIRKKLKNKIDRFIDICYNQEITHSSLSLDLRSIELSDLDKTISSLNLDIDTSIKPVKYFKGGTRQALLLLNNFITNNLKDYEEYGNNPDNNIGSKLSPYLHFGQISPAYIYKLIKEREVKAENFLEQLVIRRELSFNFIYYNQNYDKNLKKILPNWALKTLDQHLNDKREHIYDLDQLKNYKTKDKYWNAAQKEMIKTGYMNGYMRMYWGKKILEWSKSPQSAFEKLIYLNNKYFLDGRDPNSFAGIAWIFGKHDRAWKEREIFGKVRYMNKGGLKRKFDMEKYLKEIKKLD
ncbi:MAG: deoxyribodipyrimidine photo-lyase [Halanaerobiales bacterium]|nr:deoxyribodipyrimidine photo-lyase [Halanaerobiales bacterium]